jgi:PAS domain S-box-containing protein
MTTTSEPPADHSMSDEILADQLAPNSHWSVMCESEHFVQFYDQDEFLLDALTGFIGAGLNEGGVCLVIATGLHQSGLAERLKANGLDLVAARSSGTFITLDAAETLSKFMVDGLPDPLRFAAVVGSVIMQVSRPEKHLRIFGDMVAQLCLDGNLAGAVRLEQLWNDLHHSLHPFSLFCAYSMHCFAGDEFTSYFAEICQQHSQIIPVESYNALESAEERLLTITLLQQKAKSLEVEMAKHRQAKELLRFSENRYRHLFDSNLIGVFLSDFAGTFLDANQAFLDLLGYTHEELLGGAIQRDSITPPEFQHLSQQAINALQATGASGTYEKEYLHKSGKRIPVLVAVTRIEDSDTCIGFVMDNSQRKEQEKLKDQFISMASHELKTPVTSLKGFLSLLQRHVIPATDETAQHYFARINAQVNRLIKLINDLLDLSKMQSGQLAYREERFALDALVQEIVESVQETTQTHRLLLDGSTGAEIYGDRDRIGQVVINLLNNAIKYSPHAETVLVRLASDQHQIEVSVQDFGIGIAKEHQSRVFERFYQVNDHTSQTYSGLGIGLYISCEIVKRHGGQLWVESTLSEGSTFHVTLPLVSDDAL